MANPSSHGGRKTLNLPSLYPSEKTMYVGMGGGFDVCGAIPIHETLKTDAIFFNPTLELSHLGPYKPFYSFDSRCGVIPLAEAIQRHVDLHSIDTIIAVDGGVDCLMQGNEEKSGTVLADFITLAALDAVTVRDVVIACLGFGCETDEDLNHFAVLNNIARLTADGAFLGSCSLTRDTHGFDEYKAVVESPTYSRRSHIQTRVIAAVEGHFGNVQLGEDANLSDVVFDIHDQKPFINPIMPVYWFFTLDGVIKRNRIVSHIDKSRTISEAMMSYRRAVQRSRPKMTIPL